MHRSVQVIFSIGAEMLTMKVLLEVAAGRERLLAD